MRAEIAICEGGACSRNGAALLLGACAALGGADLRVVGSACTSKCPSRGVVLTNNGAQSVVPASYAAQALESAQAAIAGSSDALAAAWTAKTEADAALTAGQPKRAVPLFSEALELAPPTLLQPSHDELGALPTDFQDSVWETSMGELQFADSITSFEFGTCDDLTLTDCVQDDLTLRGQYETSSSEYGDFELLMSDDGRWLTGTLTGDREEEWTGMRAGCGGGEPPPPHVRWVHEAYVGRSRAHLAMRKPDLAADDARAATALCCRAASGWEALAAAEDERGDAAAAALAREEIAFL